MTRDEIKELMSFFDETNINKIKIKNGDFAIELEKYEPCQEPAPAPACPPIPAPAPINVVVNEKTVTNQNVESDNNIKENKNQNVESDNNTNENKNQNENETNQIDDNDDNNDLEQNDDSAVVVDGSDGAGLDSGDSASGIKSGEENDSKSIIDNNGKTTHIKIIEIDANGGIGIKNNIGNRNIIVYIIALSIFSLFFAGFIYYFNLGEKMIEYKSYF